MHMADALISPVVGGAMWVAAIGFTSHAAKQVQTNLQESKIPLMGVLGAFVFAAQMINFTIPGTGSSGHLGGGLLLAALLGPHAAFLTVASILTVQALFFADGGLLALGCNLINMGFLPCYVAYPLLFAPLAGNQPSKKRIFAASLLAAIVGLQLGAFGVVVQTWASGVSALPVSTFALLMQPIHLAIGLVEGLITATALAFIQREAPALLRQQAGASRTVVLTLLALALVTGGLLSWTASSNPDGLEWSIATVSGEAELAADGPVHAFFADLQDKLAFLPDYNFKSAPEPAPQTEAKPAAWPAVDPGTSVAGIAGALITLLLALGAGKALQHAAKH